jgi:hypothetical protein
MLAEAGRERTEAACERTEPVAEPPTDLWFDLGGT